MQHRISLWVLVASACVATPVFAAPDKVPDGFVEMFVAGVLPTEGGPAVVLRDKSEKTIVPIWIGYNEAHSIQLRLDRKRYPRPLTHDLLDAIVHDLGGEIVKIHVDDLKGDTFVGTVFVKRGEHLARFDARPSDSIALAVGNAAPIYVSRTVIDRIAAKKSEAEKEPAASDGEPEDPPAKAPTTPQNNVQTL